MTVRTHDLPPLWDDQPVTWGEWKPPTWTSAAFHTPLKDQACRRCGNLGGVSTASGRIHHDLGWVVLTAFRCDCGHDQVLDDDGELWDLDPSDYGDEGSVDPETVQGALF